MNNLWCDERRRLQDNFSARVITLNRGDKFIHEIFGIRCQVSMWIPGRDRPASNGGAAMHDRRDTHAFGWPR
jgi:hypothetical protein